MSAKQAQYFPYRQLSAPDPAFAPAPAPPFSDLEIANFLLDTRPFSGVRLLCSYASGGGTVGYTLEAWFYNRDRKEFFQDIAQTIVVNAQGLTRHEVTTDGEPVLIRVVRLDGTAATLSIERGVFSASKV